jgi:hypothetical protein
MARYIACNKLHLGDLTERQSYLLSHAYLMCRAQYLHLDLPTSSLNHNCPSWDCLGILASCVLEEI